MQTDSADFLRRTFALDGRVAVVTGASSGLGAHMAAVLAQAGCKVALAARRKARLDAVAESIAAKANTDTKADTDTNANTDTVTDTGTDTATTADILTVRMDVCDRAQVDAGFAQIEKRFGNIDILINNAGVAAPGRFLDMPEADWQTVVDTDLSAVWRVGQAAARRMAAQKTGGVIINIASILGINAQRGQANYAAAKAGVIQLTRTMALELARDGVRVNALAPGYFATEMNREFFATKRGREYLAGLLPGRAGELRELDGALLLLAGDAGSYITGSVITVDGGALLSGL